jgi:hypothetical protein
MQNRAEIFGVALLLLLSFLCIHLRFESYFHHPNSKVIEAWGDGYKTYLALFYHIKYDQTYSRLEAMNYPYGEHVVPGDAQPALSNTVRFISRNIIDISDRYRAILHFTMLTSLWLSGLFLYLIFRKLKVAIWYAIPVAIGLTFLSPPLARMGAHFGLAHPVAIPLLMYLLLRFEERPNWYISGFLAFSVLLFASFHFYFFAIFVFTITGYFCYKMIQKGAWRQWKFYAGHYSIQVILPFLFFFWWMYLNDPVTDRPSAPWGFFYARSYWESIFLSFSQPFYQWVNEHWISIRKTDPEGEAYVGMVAFAATLILLIRWVRNRLQKVPFQVSDAHQGWLNAHFYTAIILLLFACGLPFILPGLEDFLKYMGPLRQFRAAGRFAWLFYYVINILSFTLLYHWTTKGARWRTALATFAVTVLLYEASHFSHFQNLELDSIAEDEPGQRFTDIPNLNFKEFQATLPIPYYNVGAENLIWQLSGYIGQKTQTIAFQTGLPTTGAMLTRTSLSQTYNQTQLVLPPYRHPAILQDFPNQKPLLLAWDITRNNENPNSPRYLLDGAQLLYEKGELQLYRLPLQSFDDRIKKRRQTIAQAMDTTRLYPMGALLSTDSIRNFVHYAWDDRPAARHYFGKGGYEGKMGDLHVLFDNTLPAQQPGKYVFSVWTFLKKDQYPTVLYELIEYNPADGKEVQRNRYRAYHTLSELDNNGWGLVELPFEIHDPNNRIKIFFQHDELNRSPLWLDEFLIRPAATQLYRKTESLLWHNTRWWEIK